MANEVEIRFAEQDSVMAPARGAFSVTPSDTVDFTTSSSSNGIARALYIGTAGNVILLTERGTIATFLNLTTAMILPVQCKRVYTASTASGIVGLY